MGDTNPDSPHDNIPESKTPRAGTQFQPPQNDENELPYTVFSTGEKRLILSLVGFTMLFSPLTANIYFPAMNQLQSDLDTSAQLVNLSITTYLIFQALAPALFGDVADTAGRRPAFLAMFAVYTFTNLGLALQSSVPALLTLRMLQSLGCSAAVAVSYGVIADLTTAANRGGAVGAAMVATNLGPALAPVIGGAVLSGAGWRWIFWFLLLCGAVVFCSVLLFLPETARRIAGNGARLPKAWRRPLLSLLCGARIPRAGRPGAGPNPSSAPRRVPNPLRSVRVLLYKDSFCVALVSGVFYMIYYCVQASIATLFKRIYAFDDAVIGACYLSIGFGVVVGGYLNGRLLDRNYKALAKELEVEVDRIKDDSDVFPVERARLRSMVYLHVVHLAVLVGYGWVMEKDIHVAVPLVFHFALGFLETCIVQVFLPFHMFEPRGRGDTVGSAQNSDLLHTCNTLLVDIFPASPSVAAASGNLVRCGLSAGGIAAMEPLMDRMGLGGYFTLLSLVGGVIGLAGGEVLIRRGMQWRLARCGARDQQDSAINVAKRTEDS